MNMVVVNKKDKKSYRIYDITYDRVGYPHFLIYKDGQWLRLSAKHFRPYNNEDLLEVITDWSETGVLTMPKL